MVFFISMLLLHFPLCGLYILKFSMPVAKTLVWWRSYKSIARPGTGPTFFTSDHVIKNSGPCFLAVKQLILQQDTVSCCSFFLIVVASSHCRLNARIPTNRHISVCYTCVICGPLFETCVLSCEKATKSLTIKIVFKFKRSRCQFLVENSPLLLHMGPKSLWYLGSRSVTQGHIVLKLLVVKNTTSILLCVFHIKLCF